MSNLPHRIRRLSWLVNTDLVAEAFSLRKYLFEQWQYFLLSACEKVFDEAVNGDRIIHISKLELFIKVTSEQELIEVLPELIKQQIQEQLELINWQTMPTNLSAITWQKTTAKQNQFTTLLNYLRTGSLPWESAYVQTSTIASELKETCRKERSQLINYLSNHPQDQPFYFRLLQLLPEAEYLVIANALLDRFSSELRTAITEFIRLLINPANNSLSRYSKRQVISAILKECSSNSEHYLRSNLNHIIVDNLIKTGSNSANFLSEIVDIFPLLFEPQLRDINSNIVQHNQLEILINYLQTGSVFLGTAYTSTSEITVALREIYQQQRSQLINYLSNHPPNQRFYFRLLQLLPETEYFVIVNTLLDRFSIELKTAITEFIRFIIDSLNNSLDRYNQWQIISAILVECSSCSERQFRNNFTEIVTDITHQTRSDHDIFFSEIIDIFSVLFEAQLREDNFNIIQQKQRSQLIKYLSNQLQNQPFSFRLLQLIPEVELQLTDARSNSPDFYQVDDIEQQNQLEILSQAIAATDNQFPLTVNYAGLVLLYPFINPFFEATGVKETNSKIIIDSKIAHAAALLHFLATGEEELYEYELGLIKILLGLEPETPLLVSAGLLQEGNRTEAETVLQSTINYWSVLKNTSINGLRTSFLQRSGLLRRTENGWQLQVEPQSFDMLLEYLPWSISIIKLSWMKQPIYTEWQTF